MKRVLTKFAVAIAMLCGGCETETPYLDSHLGKSAEHLVQVQTLDPAAAGNPPALAPRGADGQRIKSAMDVYHKDIIKENQTISRTVTFEAGQQ